MSDARFIAWREIPLLRLLPPLVLGIYLGGVLQAGTAPAFLGIGLALTAVVLGITGLRPLTLGKNRLWGGGMLGWMLVLGFFSAQQAYELSASDHFSKLAIYDPEVPLHWSGRVVELRPGPERIRIRLRVDALADSERGHPSPTGGHLLLYLPTDSLTQGLLPGWRLEFRAKADRIAPPLNPSGFDFAAWQQRKRVFHRAYVEASAWRVADRHYTLRGRAHYWRDGLAAELRKHLPAGSNELAVGAALILGKRDELSNDLRNAYAETGAVHVLAVSGLHLGFIAWGLGILFGWGLFRKRSWRWVRLGLVLAGIWTFALLTGLSPSVQRAAVMFSFLWLGNTLGRSTSIYNSLGASALLLLLIDPYLLFDVGFQLSYLALLGIVFFQARLYRLWYPPNRLFDYAWRMTTVGIAAQLTTFPLSLYYFHQFPLYFMLTGLVVVLAASLILGLGIVLFLLSWWPLMAGLIGNVLYWVLWMNNAFIFRIRQLPGHLLSGIWIDEVILIALFASLFFLARYLVARRPAYLLTALTILAIALAANLNTAYAQLRQRSLTVYHLYKASVIDAFAGRTVYTISTIAADDPAIDWNVAPHRAKNGIVTDREENGRHWYTHVPVYGFYDQRIAVIDRDWQPAAVPPEPLNIEVLVLQNSPRLQLAELLPYFAVRQWVVDGSNYPGQVERWQEEAAELGISLHWTARDGAYQREY